jgi:hypothetical protein
MKRFFLVGGSVLIGSITAVLVAARFDSNQVFIAGDQPVSVDQVRQKLETDGWSNVQATRQGRFIVAIGSRNGEEIRVQVEALTGRLRVTDDDDPVTAEDPE